MDNLSKKKNNHSKIKHEAEFLSGFTSNSVPPKKNS